MQTNLLPLYSAGSIERPAYQLRYSWTGWPTSGSKFPTRPPEEFFQDLAGHWETDGIRYLELSWLPEEIKFTCSVLPTVSPVWFTSRIKGRLDHALRKAAQPVQFSRKVSFRTIGANSREEVEAYVANQVRKEQFVDPRFSEFLENFTNVNQEVSLKEPIATHSGRYWYNLHLVLVTESRMRMNDPNSLNKLSQLCDAIAGKKGYRVSARSLMPDHLHLALSGDIQQSPEEIALAYLNNTAYGFGQKAIWRPGYYVGTFGEYDMGAVRRNE